MADNNRQTKLAEAKKRLKEFQQKSSPLSKGVEMKNKRSKTKVHKDMPSKVKNLPDNILASDSNMTNGANPFSSQIPVGGQGTVSMDIEPDVSYCEDPAKLSNLTNSNRNASVDGTSSENSHDIHRTLSSTESLRQLSHQLNGLLSESSSYVNGKSSENPIIEKTLESQNQKLPSAVDANHVTKMEQLMTKMEQLKRQSHELQEQLQKERKEFEQKFAKEQGSMREQLQVHIQTIGILVSEKSELQTALAYTQQAARQRSVEVEDLSGRLQSGKQRVSELERTLSSVSTQQKQLEKQNKELEKERDGLRLDVIKLNRSSEEMKQQKSELGEQLKQRLNEIAAMKFELEDAHKRFEMADLTIQQLSSQAGHSCTNQVQMSLEEKLQMEAYTAQLVDSVAQLQRERDEYVSQMKEDGLVWMEKTKQLISQVALLSEERESLNKRTQELEEHIIELKNTQGALLSQEMELQAQLESAQPNVSQQTPNEKMLEESLCALQQQNETLVSQYQAQVQDNKQLGQLCQDLEVRLLELEAELQRRLEENENCQQILEEAQGNKATISRALAQNRDLKEQLTELQNGFVKLTNENMEMTSCIQSEKHVKKELAQQISELQKSLDRSMQQEKLKQLQEENLELKAKMQELNNSTAFYHQSKDVVLSSQESSDFECREETLATSPIHTRQEMRERLEDHQHFSSSSYGDSSSGLSSVPAEVYDALRLAMEKLQLRFTTVMQEKADLKERVEELEHRCIQLSGETDTIGEYITLYQNQRAIMKQKHMEKELSINMLAKEKEDLKTKLTELQMLVQHMIDERNEWYKRSYSSAENVGHHLDASDTACTKLIAPDSTEGTGAAGPIQMSKWEPHTVRPSDSPAIPYGLREDCTAQQIMQLLQEIQHPQTWTADFLGKNSCFPFFYRAAENDEVKILVL